jgi:Domain of unknown function (DUF4157)
VLSLTKTPRSHACSSSALHGRPSAAPRAALRSSQVVGATPCACGGGCPRCGADPGARANLTIGEPGDQFEQGAERIADEVGRPLESGASADARIPVATLRSATSLGAAGGPDPAGRESAPPIVHDALRSPGRPLDDDTRAFMEPRFGYDFSGVHINTGTKAADSARAVNARAFTVGRDVVFDEGQHAPGTTAGQKLLAHELSHVVQQAAGLGPVPLLQRDFWDDEEEDEEGGALDWVSEQVEGAVDWVGETGGEAVDWATETASEVVDWAAQTGGEAVEWASETGGEVADWATETGEEVVDWASETGGEMANWASETAGGAMEWFDEKTGWVKEAWDAGAYATAGHRATTDLELRLLGGNPQEAHRAWGTLDQEQRDQVVLYMGQFHGADFAQRFLQWVGHPELIHHYDSVRNIPPSRLTEWGFKFWRNEDPYVLWVHPSGQIFHYKVKFTSGEPEQEEGLEDRGPESAEEEPREDEDPIVTIAREEANYLSAFRTRVFDDALACWHKTGTPEYQTCWCQMFETMNRFSAELYDERRKFPEWDAADLPEEDRAELDVQKFRIESMIENISDDWRNLMRTVPEPPGGCPDMTQKIKVEADRPR